MRAFKSEVSTICEILDLPDTQPASYLHLNDALKDGLPRHVIEHVARTLGIPAATFRRYIIADRTYQRRVRRGENFTRGESEKLYRAARIFAQTNQCFRNECKAQRFLTMEHPLLDGHVPIELVIESEAGFQAVAEVL
ncbi:antitoxin Xre-like helix-turn-helix domain-containing protein [Salinisphaera sp. RV14]|uniref:antitoxin Xre-like helix-turn-helix domain-containing protein n=1 Tax=unclassified Salinisphaera TaxID=2649847 RepID=UPI003F83A30D